MPDVEVVAQAEVTAPPEVAAPAVPNGTGQPEPAGTSEPPSAAPATQKPAKIDLTALPEFRAYQAERDRKEAQREADSRKRLADLERKLASLEDERVSALDPAEQVEHLKKQLAAERARQSEEAKRAEAAARAQGHVAQMQNAVTDAGLEWNDGRIWNDPDVRQNMKDVPDSDTVVAVQRAVLRIQRADLEAARRKADEAAKVAEQRAKQKALVDAGVTTTSNAAPTVVAPPDERAARIAEFKRRFNSCKGKGIDNPQYKALMADMHKAGIGWADMGY